MPPSDDSALRKRTTSEKQSSAHSPPAATPSASYPAKASGSFPKLLLAFVSIALSTYFAYTKFSLAAFDALSDSYALCSREGAQIYTLDPEKPRAQCLVVHGSTFTSTGSLGTSSL